MNVSVEGSAEDGRQGRKGEGKGTTTAREHERPGKGKGSGDVMATVPDGRDLHSVGRRWIGMSLHRVCGLSPSDREAFSTQCRDAAMRR